MSERSERGAKTEPFYHHGVVMHELGIVFYIVDDVKEVAQQNAVSSVQQVIVEIGEVSGVVPELLQDAWKWAAAKEPLLEGAELICEITPALSLCEDCKETFSPTKFGRTCPACGSFRTHLIQGQGATIKNIAAI